MGGRLMLAFRAFGMRQNAIDGTIPGQFRSESTMYLWRHLLPRWRAGCTRAVAAVLLACVASPGLAADDQFLEPEKAFRFSA
jgi:hypothetical protein